MSALSAKLATPLPPEASSVQQKCYVTYYHPSAPSDADAQPLEKAGYNHITLLESRSLISAGGTTGLRTWEAALHLGRFLCAHPDIVRGRHILELGAGTGYLSILCARHLEAAHVIASDGSDDVLYNLPDNLFLNELEHTSSATITSQEQVSVPHESQATYGTVTLMDIKWGYALLGTEEEKWNGGRPVDVVLGADVTYDRSVIPSLVGTVLELFALYPQVEVYISATQRNRDTFQVFLDVCQGHGLKVDDFEFKVPAKEDQEGPFYSDEVEIRICRVSQSKK
jgi:predicted nicotinamide N-methyase